MLRALIGLAALSIGVSACVIVVDGEDDVETDGFRLNFAAVEGVATTAPLPAFDAINVSAGTDVTVRKGATREIRLDARAAAATAYEVDDGSLRITCRKPCRSGNRGKVEVISPDVPDTIAASSGASLNFEGGWGEVPSLTASVSSGAALDASQLDAQDVTVSASSGGSVRVSADDSLTASASSGGSVNWTGDAQDVNVAQSSGGSVSPSR